MIQRTVINVDIFGAQLAVDDDEKQAKFLKGFAGGLKDFPTTFEVEIQGANVHNKLTDKERELLRHFFDLAIGEVGTKQ